MTKQIVQASYCDRAGRHLHDALSGTWHAAADDILVVRPLAPVRDRRLEPALALVVAVVHERPPGAALMPVALAAALGPLVDVSALPQVDPVAVLVVSGTAKI